MLQRVFQMVVVWVQDMDWHAGQKWRTGYRTQHAQLAARGVARQLLGRRQPWGWRGQNFLSWRLLGFVSLSSLVHNKNSWLTKILAQMIWMQNKDLGGSITIAKS